MTLNFTYNRDQDIWCLLEKGPTSINSPFPTEIYKKLVKEAGERPDKDKTSTFIDNYLNENKYNINEYIKKYEEEWRAVHEKFEHIAENIFKVHLDNNITAYLTINNRCPYSIEKNMFFVSISKNYPIKTIMHELWHFYTWRAFGADEQKRIGFEKYNDIKEALTVLLNTECADLLPTGTTDNGYPQHIELRKKILSLWKENPDINFVWQKITAFS